MHFGILLACALVACYFFLSQASSFVPYIFLKSHVNILHSAKRLRCFSLSFIHCFIPKSSEEDPVTSSEDATIIFF